MSSVASFLTLTVPFHHFSWRRLWLDDFYSCDHIDVPSLGCSRVGLCRCLPVGKRRDRSRLLAFAEDLPMPLGSVHSEAVRADYETEIAREEVSSSIRVLLCLFHKDPIAT